MHKFDQVDSHVMVSNILVTNNLVKMDWVLPQSSSPCKPVEKTGLLSHSHHTKASRVWKQLLVTTGIASFQMSYTPVVLLKCCISGGHVSLYMDLVEACALGH